jgi:hypothetical protein
MKFTIIFLEYLLRPYGYHGRLSKQRDNNNNTPLPANRLPDKLQKQLENTTAGTAVLQERG